MLKYIAFIGIALFGIISLADADCKFCGTFEKVVLPGGNPDNVEVLKASGFAEDMAKTLTSIPLTAVITTTDDKVFTLILKSAQGDQTKTFTLGQEFDETLFDGRKSKTTFQLDGDGDTTTMTRKIGDITFGASCKLISAEVTCTVNCGGKSGTVTWKKIA